MRKPLTLLATVIICLAQQSFAAQPTSSYTSENMSSTECGNIARACVAAGYTKETANKTFWMDCMHPILMGKAVGNVTVTPTDVSACRDFKIQKMQTEIQEFQQVKSSQ